MSTHTSGEETRVGPYLVQDVLGAGPHGTAYSVLHEEKHERLVLKRFHEPVKERPGKVFNRIAKVVVALTHPTIADVRHTVLLGSRVAIIGEVVEGRPLSEVLTTQGALAPADAVGVTRQICAGLQYAHQRCVYHTSLRPENIFLMPDGGVRITDFAIAALYGHAVRKRPRYTAQQQVYFAPEFRDRGVIHPPSDVFSLGVLLFSILNGGIPTPSVSDGPGRFSFIEVEGSVANGDGLPLLDVDRLPATTPAELRATIAASIAPDPGRRPGSVNAFADLLRGTRAMPRLSRLVESQADSAPGATTAPGPRVRVCSACGRPVSPAGRVCLACGLLLREATEATEAEGYYHRHARRLLANGDIDAAESAYRRGVKRQPQNPELHNELGDVLAVQNRFEEAVSCYKRAVELNPDDDDAWHDLGVSLAALHRRKTAREALERAVALTKRAELRLSALLHLGAIAAEEGRADEAIERWESVLSEDPGLIPVRMALASTYAARSQFEQAEEQLFAVLSIEPGQREAQNLMARVRERSQLERADTDTSFGLMDDLGGGQAYLGPGFRWLRLR